MIHEVDGSFNNFSAESIRLVEYIVALMGILRAFQHLGVCFQRLIVS